MPVPACLLQGVGDNLDSCEANSWWCNLTSNIGPEEVRIRASELF